MGCRGFESPAPTTHVCISAKTDLLTNLQNGPPCGTLEEIYAVQNLIESTPQLYKQLGEVFKYFLNFVWGFEVLNLDFLLILGTSGKI